jgi:hypothetical protein
VSAHRRLCDEAVASAGGEVGDRRDHGERSAVTEAHSLVVVVDVEEHPPGMEVALPGSRPRVVLSAVDLATRHRASAPLLARRRLGRVELALDALDALDRARGAHQLLDLALAVEAATEVDDAALGVDAHVRLRDAGLPEGLALDLLRD